MVSTIPQPQGEIMASTKTLAVKKSRRRRRRGIEDLPPELLEEIFSRIPFHYLIQTTYVCQPWRNLISHPLFPIPNHPTHIFFCTGHQMYFIPDIETCDKAISLTTSQIWKNNDIRSFRTLGSLNGFICLETCAVANKLFGSERLLGFTIWNPFTGDPIELRPCLPLHYTNEDDEMDIFTGFGYSPNTKQYKVIRIISSYREYVFHVTILTLGSNNAWRNIGPLANEEDSWRCTSRSIFLNGYLHWLTFRWNAKPFSVEFEIKAFNVEDETFGLISIPPSLVGTMTSPRDKFYIHLEVLANCLILVDSSERDTDVWMRKDYGVDKSWVLQFVIPGYGMPDGCSRGVQPLTLQKNGNILCYKFGWHENDTTMFSYDPKTKTTNEFQVTGLPDRAGMHFDRAISHVGNLLTLENHVVHMQRR